MTDLLDTLDTELYIGGAFTKAAGASHFSVLDPANEEELAAVGDASVADALDALDAAHRAQPAWAATAPRERGEVLRRAYAAMIERRDDLARLIVLENGKTMNDARAEVNYAADFFRWFSEEAVRISGDLMTAPSGANRIITVPQPVGVALLVTPWNFPAAMLTRKIGPALAAGCTVVCKPAEDTPLTALALATILEECGAPAGVVNIVPTSRPAEIVAALVADDRVRKLSFTGSTEVGRLLLHQAADRIVNTSMELGGNAPFIVFEDADLDAAITGALIAKMRNGGEACTSANRFFAARPVAEEFAHRLAEAMGKLRVGPGIEPESEVGPLVNADAREKVESLVDAAVADGATALIGGHRNDGRGYFYAPTVLENVPENHVILSTEIFGPVAPIVAFDDEAEVIAAANAIDQGLVSYLYSRDLARAMRVAEALEAGMVGINRGLVSDAAAPFGGVKQSGIGREGGKEGIAAYLETKYIATTW